MLLLKLLLIPLISLFFVLFLTTPTILAGSHEVSLNITPPENVGFLDIATFVRNTLITAFVVAILVVLVMLIWGAFEWITSGGDKEAVGKARNRIINALIGLAVLAVAFALTVLAANFIGYKDLSELAIPRPTRSIESLQDEKSRVCDSGNKRNYDEKRCDELTEELKQ